MLAAWVSMSRLSLQWKTSEMNATVYNCPCPTMPVCAPLPACQKPSTVHILPPESQRRETVAAFSREILPSSLQKTRVLFPRLALPQRRQGESNIQDLVQALVRALNLLTGPQG